MTDASRLRKARYRRSAKGQATRLRYQRSAEGKAAKARYKQSEKGKAAAACYRRSPAGKAVRARADARYKAKLAEASRPAPTADK
jgi:hypothetical protein